MPKLTPNLWFDDNAEEAAAFYLSVFPNSRIVRTLPYTESTAKAGQTMAVEFELDGQRFVGINGGPQFTFDEAVSFQIDCADQAEVDHYWDRLTADGGRESMCGWVEDRFGLSWQVVPVGWFEILEDPDPERADRAVAAMLQMRKLDLAALKRAADGVAAA